MVVSFEFFCHSCEFSSHTPSFAPFEISCTCSLFTWSCDSNTRLEIKTKLTKLDECYIDNYAFIAKRDLASPIQHEMYLRTKSLADLNNIGDVHGLEVLEVGPGYGHLAKELARAGARVTILDVIPDYLDLLEDEKDIKAILGDASKLGVRNSFDIVILCDVLEHVFRPSDVLFWAYKALKATGKIYVRVPSHEANLSYSPFYGCPFELVHLRTYTKDLLLREILSAGFSKSSNPRYLKDSLRYPKNRVVGVKHYWFVKRLLLAKIQDIRSQPLIIQILGIFYDGSYGNRFTKIQSLLNFLRKPFTKPGEIFVLARK